MTDEGKVNLAEISTQLALLAERMGSLQKTVEKSVNDHEDRIRALETSHGEMKRDIATIRERMTVFNMLQSGFAALAASFSYWLSKR